MTGCSQTEKTPCQHCQHFVALKTKIQIFLCIKMKPKKKSNRQRTDSNLSRSVNDSALNSCKSKQAESFFLIWQSSSATLPVKAATARMRNSGSYLLMLTCCVVTFTRQWLWWLLAAVLVICGPRRAHRLALQVQRSLETPSIVWEKKKSLRCPVHVCVRVFVGVFEAGLEGKRSHYAQDSRRPAWHGHGGPDVV